MAQAPNPKPPSAAHKGNQTETDDNSTIIRRILKSYSDSELQIVTLHYRRRLEEVIDYVVQDMTSVLGTKLKVSEFVLKEIRQLVNSNQKREASKVLLGVIAGASAQVQRIMWEAFVKMQENNPQLKTILGEIQEKGKDLLTEIFRTWCEEKVPEEMRVAGHQDVEFMEQKQNMELATLGRPFQLGMLYDCRSDSLIPGVTLWDWNMLNSNRDVRSQINTAFQIIESDSIQDKSSAMNVSGELQTSLLGGMIQVQGSAKYLNDTQKSKKQARVTLHYSTTTKIEQLTISRLGHQNVFDQGLATHVVTAVLFGAQAFFVFDREILSSEKLTDVQCHMKSMISNIPKIQIDGTVSQKLTEEEKANHQKLRCTFYSDFYLPSNQITFQEAMDIYTSLSRRLGEDGEHAVPMKVWLHSLSELDSNAGLLVRGISVNLISSLQAILENFNEVDMRCSDMIKEFDIVPFQQITGKLQCFRAMCVEQRQSLQKSLSTVLPSIREGGKEEGHLADILINNQQSEVGNQLLLAWLDNTQLYMSVVRTILITLEDIKFVTQDELQKKLQMVPMTQYLVCLMFTSLDEENLCSSEMENCLESESIGKGYLPTSADPGKEPLFFSPNKMIDCARSFLELYTANKSDLITKFLISSLPDKNHRGASIHLYDGGKLVSKCFKPPEKPRTPSVCGKAPDSITLKLQTAFSDASQIVSYRLEYRAETEEAWDTQTIDNISDTHIISGLSPYQVYYVRYRTVGKTWVNQASDSVSVRIPPTSAPGKPSMEHLTEFHVKVTWEKPTLVGNGVTIHHYKVQYKEIRNTSSAECHEWQVIQTDGSKCLHALLKLNPSTTYTLRVSADCDQAGESATSQEASITIENKPMSLARYCVKQSKILAKGNPIIYQLQLQKMKCEIEGATVKCRFGKESPTHNVKTIMVLGATGSGKTTLINAMINYILGVEWEDDFRYKLIHEETNKSQAESQTSSITSYELVHQKGFKIPHSLILIDTPGFGDTRGITQDKHIMNLIREFFTSPYGVDQIDAVCFVAQASLARLTPTQKYIFDSILSIFGNDIAENIRVLVTFADGQLPPVLDAINKSDIPCPKDNKGRPLHFKFNNSAIFAQIGTSGDCDDDEENFDQMFWKMGSSSMKKFFAALDTMQSKSLRLTKEVLQERKHLDITVQGLEPQINVGLSTLEEIRKTKQVMQQHEDEAKANQNFEYEITVTVAEMEDISGNKHYITNCQQCHFTCHYPCNIADDNRKRGCFAIDGNGYCRACPGKCIWSVHYNQKYRFNYVKKTEKKTYQELKDKYEKASGEKMTQEKVMQKLEEEFVLIEEKVVELVETLARCLARLKEIALRPNPLSTPEYIDLLIEAEKQEIKPGYIDRIQSLNEIKNQAVLLAKVAKNQPLLTYESEKLKKQKEVKQGIGKKMKGWIISWLKD